MARRKGGVVAAEPTNIVSLAAARLQRTQPRSTADKEAQIRELIQDIADGLGIDLQAAMEKHQQVENERIEKLVAARIRSISDGRAS